jgi:outer membrane protein assembly factor BamD (BamD/ComL family)
MSCISLFRHSFKKKGHAKSLGRASSLLALNLVGCATSGGVSLPPPPQAAPAAVRGQDDEEGWTDRLNPKKISAKIKRAAGYGPNRQRAEAALAEGEKLFVEATSLQGAERSKRFKEAADKYKTAAGRWPDSSLEEDALFMLSESYFFADRYPAAASTYERLVKKYPNTRHMDTIDQRRFALARYWVEHQQSNPDLPFTPNVLARDRPVFDKFGHGVRVLDKIRFDDPTGKLADDATMAAGLAEFKAGDYMRADELLTDLRRSFPNSEHQFRAHLLGLQCKLKIYQGSQYSLQPMDDAEQLIKQIQRQFPQEAQEHAKYLAATWQEVRLNKADHEWQMARYYHKRKEHAAARQYYERVRDDFGDTSLAKDATAALEEIADAPDKPEQPLPWVAKLFPTPERAQPLVARNPLESLRR